MTMLAKNYLPFFTHGGKLEMNDILGYGYFLGKNANAWYVDGTNGSDSDTGRAPGNAYATIGQAISSAASGDVIYVFPKAMAAGATDPSSYAEALTIPAGKTLALLGVRSNRTQGGLPQIKKGSGSAALLTIQSPGCLIANLGFNGGSSTGGGILLDDDGSTKSAFGTMITGCHFKNCVGSSATDSRTGGAIMWAAAGNAWQVSIVGNQFYKNVGGIVLKGTSGSVPQDVLIANNDFLGTAATVDSYMYLAAGSGMANVMIRDNYFASVLPALGSGSVVRYVDLTGCTGIFANNYVASTDTTTGFGVAKASAKIPLTVGIAHNYSDGGLIVREA